MATPDHPSQAPVTGPIPSRLEQQLQLCEGIVERMRVLQEQVDWELRQLQAQPAADRPYEAAPAIRVAMSGILRWLGEALGTRRA